MRRVAILFALALALSAPAAARAGGPALGIGVAEDDVGAASLVQAKARLGLARLAGMKIFRFTMVAWPDLTAPTEADATRLANVAAAARLNGLRLYLSVYNPGGRLTPLTDEQQDRFAQYATAVVRRAPYVRDVIVGNEPNLSGFWQPQFDEDGGDAAAPAYLALLARTYDALKLVSPKIRVVGGALAPRGGDNPSAVSKNHSPTTFIRDLGDAYRLSGRDRPIMDAFAIHPYEQNSSQPPTTRNGGNKSIAIADYGKLVRLLGNAFDGTPQAGSTLPIVYGEFGVEARIPAAKRRAYTGKEPASVKAVSEAMQAAYYRQALQLAYCQANVEAMMLFHLYDERDLGRWQSGLYYADRTPRRATLAAVVRATDEARRGVLARCPGLALTPVVRTAWSRPKGGRLTFRLRCSIDCRFSALVVTPAGKRVAAVSGVAVGARWKTVAVRKPLPRGRFRVRVSLVAALNAGPAVTRQSPAFYTTATR